MPWSFVLVLLPALVAWAVVRRHGGGWREVLRLAALATVGLLIASPFATDRAVGTGESYNYSLAVADTVAQLRQGVFPVTAGQTEYAFNGRVHPLRTAVAFTHAAGLLDFLTLHQLPFWQVQNLLLALSLNAAVFTAYLTLRRVAPERPGLAALLAAWYGCSPALLAAAYGQDLYMTVTAAPFLPLAIAGALLAWRDGAFRAFALLATGLGGAWLAHPPVAGWATVACGPLVVGGLLRHRLRPRVLVALAGAALLGLALAGWAFVSVRTLGSSDLLQSSAVEQAATVDVIVGVLRELGWQALAPVSAEARGLADFQLGYAGWALLLASGVLAWRSKSVPAALLTAIAAVGLLLCLRVPGVSEPLWRALPARFAALTNIWPMQRGYLVIGSLLIFAVAAARPLPKPPAGRRGVAAALLGLLVLWTGAEAAKFLRRGFSVQRDEASTRILYAPHNIDLTVTSYAFLPVPGNYVPAPREPGQELRVLARTSLERILADNATQGGAPRVAASGTLRVAGASDTLWPLEPNLRLEPGKRYRLTLDFLATSGVRNLLIRGPVLFRELPLDDRARPRAFGPRPGQIRSLPLATARPEGETVRLDLVPAAAGRPPFGDYAHFQLEEIDPAQLPVKLIALSPALVCDVDSPEPGWLETPRAYRPGYRAKVDGRVVEPRRGPDGLVLVPVPAGKSRVELRPSSTVLLRDAARLAVATWAVLAVAGLALLLLPHPRGARLLDYADRIAGAPALGVALALFAMAAGWQVWRNRALGTGPLVMQVAFPVDRVGKLDPLFAVGDDGQATTFFARYPDLAHVEIGFTTADAVTFVSAPILLDFAKTAELRVTTGLFYPEVPGLAPADAQRQRWLRETTRIWLDGQEILTTTRPPPAGVSGRVAIGERAKDVGAFELKFGGAIAGFERRAPNPADCPFPSSRQLATEAGPLRLRLRLPPNETGICQPLLSLGAPGSGLCLFAHYVAPNQVRLGIEGPGTAFVQTEPLPHDYGQPLELTLSLPELYPAENPALADYSPRQRDNLVGFVRIEWQGRTVLKVAGDPAKLRGLDWGRNSVGAKFPSAAFTGVFLGSQRLAVADWPVPPGRPEAATAADSFGAVELLVRFPAVAAGRTQPLLVSGQAGEAALVLVNYVDSRHVRLGVDVWGRTLHWSEPLEVDYAARHRVRIAHSALFPPANAGDLPRETLARLRGAIELQLDGRVVLHKEQFAYDAPPASITPGESRIGGSNSEAVFTGEILDVRRVPVTR